MTLQQFAARSLVAFTLLLVVTTTGFGQKTVVDVAVGSADHSTLVAAVKAAGLVETLSGKGPFTVFAPTNAAFAKLPAGTVETLLKPENKAQLTAILTYHVVPGKLLAKDVITAIKKGGGSTTVTTVQGTTLFVALEGTNVVITDGNGGKATITATNLMAGNGVVHVLDTVVLPKQ
ncbi:MAG: fasciclin domain-containing protein [Bacteroidia bacterium]|nr:fasciclin domain-containing protein [Bacteroidia bacterium]